MANLRANRITSTEVFETTGSVQFDGSGDYLSLSSNDGFDFGSGSFTIEAWVYPKTLTSDIVFATSNTTGGFFFGRRNSGSYIGYGRLNTAWDNSSGNDLIINQWNHVAVCRESNNNIRVFLNGIQSGPTQSLSTSYNLNTLTIGGTTSDYYVNGHISNLRVLKGTALYTKNFTPPTRELEVIPNTVLLCAQSKTQANREATGKTITVNGNAVANELTPGLLTNVVKSGGSSAITGSVEFDGTGDYLTFSGTSTDFAFGTGDFTIEGWFYRNVSATYQLLIDFRLDSSSDVAPMLYLVNGVPYLYTVGGNRINGGQSVSNNSWFHLALCRYGTNTRLFLNGNQIGSTYSDSNNYVNKTNRPIIGSEGVVVGNNPFNGFISNLRIIKGTALYTSNFIPPTRKLTKLPGTVLLCCQDSNDPTTEATGKTITGYGDLDRADIGVELVTNGTFNTDTTGWTAWLNSSISVSSGNLRIDSTSTYAYVYTSFSTKPGSGYRVSLEFTQGTSTFGYFRIGTSIDNDSLASVFLTTSKKYEALIRATSSTTYITLVMAGGNGTYSLFDNVSAYKIDPGPKPPFVSQIGSDGTVVFDGTTKINTPNYFYLPTGPTEQRAPINNNYGARGILGGGYNGSVWLNSLQYVTIATTGNALDFGDLSSGRPYVDAVSSSTRGVFGGGYGNNTMDYITISSTGNAADFGDSTSARRDYAGCSNSTRGLFGGGQGTNIIDYITISSIGNAVDFGDLQSVRYFLGACASPVRGLFAGGDSGAPFALRGIDYVTIASAGNSQTFGGLTNSRSTIRGCSNSIRGVFSGGYTLPGSSNTIDYVNISSTGTATDFGDMTTARGITSAFSSSLRGLFTNWTPSTGVSAIDYINITSTSNALDFGDTITQAQGGCSSGHGGLG